MSKLEVEEVDCYKLSDAEIEAGMKVDSAFKLYLLHIKCGLLGCFHKRNDPIPRGWGMADEFKGLGPDSYKIYFWPVAVLKRLFLMIYNFMSCGALSTWKDHQWAEKANYFDSRFDRLNSQIERLHQTVKMMDIAWKNPEAEKEI